MKYVFLIAGVILTAGCGPVKYQGPDSGPRATLEFVNKSTDKISTEIYKGPDQCTDRIITGPVDPGNHKAITITAEHDSAFSIINSSLSRNVAIGLGGAIAAASTDDLYRNCSPSIKFHPKDGRLYRLYLEEIDGDCRFRITERKANQAEEPLKANEFQVRQWQRAWTEAGPWCP